MKTDRLLTHEDSPEAMFVWNSDIQRDSRDTLWCFWRKFALRVRKMNSELYGSSLYLTLYDPFGEEAWRISLDRHMEKVVLIPIETAHCIANLLGNAGDDAFYGNRHDLIEKRFVIETQTGAQLRKFSVPLCHLMSRRADRLDILTMFDEKLGRKTP